MKFLSFLKKNIFFISIIALFLFIGILTISITKKYESFEILSVKNEYNYVFNERNDTLSISLYFEKNNSFLTKKDQVKSTYIENENYKLSSYLEDIKKGDTVKYNNKTFYEFYYVLSFNQYDDYTEPLFIENGLFTVNYKNGETMTYTIGNLNLYFNTNEENDSSLSLLKLSCIQNEINDKYTICGINLSILNEANSNIYINSIEIKNPFYELDYLKYERSLLSQSINLKERDSSYSYESYSIEKGNMNLRISPKKYVSLFIPLKYLNGIKELERFPLYITYTIDGVTKTFIIDDFNFLFSIPLYRNNGVKVYEYNYK